MKRHQAEIERRAALGEESAEVLTALRDELAAKRNRLRERIGREELMAALARRRALRASGDALLGARLDLRLQRLFEAVRGGAKPWPVDEVVRVLDGLIGRLISRRLSLAGIGLLTVIPAVASLVLLAKQNESLIEKNVAEETADFREDRVNLTDLIFSRTPQLIGEGEEARVIEVPNFHPRLRAEAFGTLIALEKQRWSVEEREAFPPVRFVDLRGGDLSYLALGGLIGLEQGALKNDFSQLRLDGADLTGGQLLFSRLDGSVFRGGSGEGLKIVSPSADGADFSDFHGAGMRFEYNAKTSDFCSMVGTVFDRANLAGAVFEMVYLEKAGFSETNLEGAIFLDARFFECDFTTARIGESADWSGGHFHRCLVTDAQAAVITLAEYCYFEPSESAGIQRIMTDPEKYFAWQEKQAAELEAAARKEMEALGTDRSEESEVDSEK